jgi:hypothetical protein
MKNNIILILLIFFLSSNIYSQDIIWLMDGKKIQSGEIKVDTSDYIIYKTPKGKFKSIDKFDVFSVSIKNDVMIFYVPDSASDSFTISQMQDYLQGRLEGRDTKAPYSFAGGVATGLGAPILLPLAGIGTIFTPLVPATYDVIVGVSKIKDEKISISEVYQSNPYYIEGYKTSVKKKRINNAILGSVIGVTVGLTASFFIYDIGYEK